MIKADPAAPEVLEEARPIFVLPSLYATDSMRAELYGRGPKVSDGPESLSWLGPVLQEIRVYRVSDLKRVIEERKKSAGEASS